MKKAKVRTLSVRPIKSTDLAFPFPGVLRLQASNARLGERVKAFDLEKTVLAGLSVLVDTGSDTGKIKKNSSAIESAVRDHLLFSQGNGRLAADLDQAIANQYADFLEKYANADATASALRAENSSRIDDFEKLNVLIKKRHTELSTAYSATGETVVKTLTSLSRHEDDSPAVVRTFTAPMQLLTPGYTIAINGGGMAAPMTHVVPEVQVNPRVFKNGAFQSVSEELSANLTNSKPIITGALTQVSETVQKPVITTNELPSYNYPSIDEEIESLAASGEIDSSYQERLIRRHRLINLEKILHSEETAGRLEVRKRQLALLDSYLLPPFDGIITAIYKDIGEYVQAGEPVMRVENDDKLLLVGFIQCKALVTIGMRVNFKVNNIFESGEMLSMTGHVVAVRGHDSDDDEWDVAIEVDNEHGQVLERKDKTTSRIKPPLNLQFDKYETEITLE
jgi:HlyD family secretion protein